MATPEDLKINAEHIRIADQFVEVPGGTNNNNYVNVQLIVEVSTIDRPLGLFCLAIGLICYRTSGCTDGKRDILGPPSAAMAALGDKIGSSLIAQAAGVPTLPWSGSHVTIPQESCRSIPEELYKDACVSTTEELYKDACVCTIEEAVASCQVVGYPAMIKASWGGGCKGIRKVHNDDEARALFKQVQGEVPGSPIFIMKVASQMLGW
ncbi:acetyl-CoA carboxylase 1-like [Oryza brachyantha]|uniref:Carbamoyl phosphate synthase ATP-binding domain-containing protein n=1 Tax=Oryza brachyantha TaxID=4533 RepID=J3N222_ORYBR|nr:acetyl-CoA carboxylase 1-like [Oryza brachyantha]